MIEDKESTEYVISIFNDILMWVKLLDPSAWADYSSKEEIYVNLIEIMDGELWQGKDTKNLYFSEKDRELVTHIKTSFPYVNLDRYEYDSSDDESEVREHECILKIKDRYFKIPGYYDSWNDSSFDFEAIYEVEPVKTSSKLYLRKT